MGLFDSLFKPDIVKLEEKKDFNKLVEALNYKDNDIRKQAIQAIGRFKDPKVEDLLLSLLKDTDSEIARCAAEVLDKKGWKPARNKNSAYYWITKRNWQECIKLGEIAVEPLINAMNRKEWEVKSSVARVLGQIKDVRAIKPLVNAMKDENFVVIKSAAQALGDIKDPKSIEPLLDAFEHGNKKVRESAAEVLDKMGMLQLKIY
jgi:HEAT repeat protein